MNLPNSQQLDLKGQRRVRWNLRRPARRAVGELWRQYYPSFATHFHRLESFVPAGDKPGAKVNSAGGPSYRSFKLPAIREPADVVDFYSLPHLRRRAVTDLQIHVLESGSGRDFVPRLALARNHIRHRRSSHGHYQNDYQNLDVESLPSRPVCG